jgi:hypothetical protein
MATPSSSRPRPGRGWIAFAGIMTMLAGAIDFFNGIWAFDAGNAAEAQLDAWLSGDPPRYCSPASASGRRAQANRCLYQPVSGASATPWPDEWIIQPSPT